MKHLWPIQDQIESRQKFSTSPSVPQELESQGWQPWILRYFGPSFSRPFTKYQHEFWDWGWQIEADTYYRPRVECEPRGVGKSTSTESWIVSLLARFRRKTIGYVSLDDDKATQHFNSIKRKLENTQLLVDYPHLRPRVQKYRNAFSSWSQDRLVTEAGQVLIPITLMGSNRGFKSDDDVRFDLLILDDIDKLGQSIELVRKNLELLKGEILAAGFDKTLVVMPQNLVHRNSICKMIEDQRADIISDRDFRGPYPLMRWYDAERIDVEGDATAKRWVITDGEPFDPAIDVAYCEALLNRFGKDTFDRECQQDVMKVDSEKSFREYDELYHVITWSEFAAFFGDIARDLNGRPRIPARWKKERGLDWGTTVEHPSAVIFSTRPGVADPLKDCVFTFGEIIRPIWPPIDPHADAELVSPGRVARAIKDFQRQHMINETEIKGVMSHEASAALNTFLIDLPQEEKVFFSKWKARKGSGVPQIQEVLAIDRTKQHPFRRDPVSGEPIMGRPRHYIVVADGQGELYYDAEGQLKVRQAVNEKGLARLRAEIPEFNEYATGAHKIFDDAVDGWRGEAAGFFVTSAAQTKEEMNEQKLRPEVRLPAILAEENPEIQQAKIQSRDLYLARMKAEQDRMAASRRIIAAPRVRFRR